MPVITSRLHGIIDYIVGAALIAAPWLFGFANFDTYPEATWTPIVIGAAIIGMSLMTNYEYSIAKIIPLRAHLAVDFAAALFLGVSPWLFSFAEYVYLPHVLAGIAEIAIVCMTSTVAYVPNNKDTYVTRNV